MGERAPAPARPRSALASLVAVSRALLEGLSDGAADSIFDTVRRAAPPAARPACAQRRAGAAPPALRAPRTPPP